MYRSSAPLFSIVLSLVALSACGSTGKPAEHAPITNLKQQLARGAEVFGNQCARCHGSGGEGTSRAPRLVGKGAFPLHAPEDRTRKPAFHNAYDIAGFVLEAMPPSASARAEILAEDYFAVLAFALSANGVALPRMVDAELAKSIVLNP